MNGITAVELEVEQLNNLILAAENWHKNYKKDPDNFAKLIKVESRLETILRRYFKEQAERVVNYIDWMAYGTRLREVAAAAGDLTVDVMISDDALGAEDGLFIQTAYDPVAQAVALGAQAGEKIYSVDVGMTETSQIIQRTAKEQVAELVGKRVDSAGNIIDNPRKAYSITDGARKAIRESISTSLSLGEDQNAAVARLQKTIANPKRAGTIARTEAVNGYQRGMLATGKTTGAVGKEWQSVNFDDICGTNANAGPIKLDADFPSGHKGPAAHPNCRCGLRLIYPEDPAAASIKSSTFDGPSSDLSYAYHGAGHNMSNGNYAFGDTFYVARDKAVAEEFGKVKKFDLNISKDDILFVSDDEQYTDLVTEALRTYRGENFNTSFPKLIRAKGYKAIEMSSDLDPLGGIAIVDPKLFPGKQ